MPEGELSEEINESFDVQTRLPNYRTKRSAVEFLMIRNNQLSKRFVTAQYHVAPMLAPENETGSRQGFDALFSRNSR